MAQPPPDDFDCALIIADRHSLHMIRASFDETTRDILVEPRRLVWEDPPDVNALLGRYRAAGYRAEFVGQDDGYAVYSVIDNRLILSTATFVGVMQAFLAGGGADELP